MTKKTNEIKKKKGYIVCLQSLYKQGIVIVDRVTVGKGKFLNIFIVNKKSKGSLKNGGSGAVVA